MDDEGFGVERKTVKHLISFFKLPTWHGKWAEPILELQLLVYTFVPYKQFKFNDISRSVKLLWILEEPPGLRALRRLAPDLVTICLAINAV